MPTSYLQIQKQFLTYNTRSDVIIASPGMGVNIIGEHTDYEDGYVLPAAINYYIYIAISKNSSDRFNRSSI